MCVAKILKFFSWWKFPQLTSSTSGSWMWSTLCVEHMLLNCSNTWKLCLCLCSAALVWKPGSFHATWSYLTRTTQSKRGFLIGCLGKSGDPSVCRLWGIYCEPYLLLVASYPSMPFPPPSSCNLMESQWYCSFMQSLQWTQKRLLFLTLSL